MARVGAFALVALALVFIAAMGLFAWGFFASGSGIGFALGVGVAILAPVVLWTVYREVRFGLDTQALGKAEAREDFLSGIDLQDFAGAKALAERAPGDWRSWYRLSLAYETNRDRRGARKAMRHAISTFRSHG